LQLGSRRRRRVITTTPEDRQVIAAAKKYTVIFQPWLPTETFFRRSDEDDDDDLHALIDMLPASVRGHRDDYRYLRLYHTAMSNQRSTAAYRVRTLCGSAIFECNTIDLTDSEKRKNSPRWANLLGYNPEKLTYSRLPPVLYSDDPDLTKSQRMFQGLIPLVILKVVLFGPASLLKYGKKLNTPTVSATLWGLEEVTAGAIAFAVTLARWAISPDDTFEAVGKTSRITYYKDFLWYREYLNTGMRENKRSVRTTFYRWNKELFPKLFEPIYEEDDAELEDAMDELRQETRRRWGSHDTEDDGEAGED